MRTTIDDEGRIPVPKPLQDQLGFAPGVELELDVTDGRLTVADEEVRSIIERERH